MTGTFHSEEDGYIQAGSVPPPPPITEEPPPSTPEPSPTPQPPPWSPTAPYPTIKAAIAALDGTETT